MYVASDCRNPVEKRTNSDTYKGQQKTVQHNVNKPHVNYGNQHSHWAISTHPVGIQLFYSKITGLK